MGIEDRDYIRNRPREPMLGPPGAGAGGASGGMSAIVALLIVNGLVWLIWQFGAHSTFMWSHFTVSWSSGGAILANGSIVEWVGVQGGYVHTLLTSTISHQGLFHLLMNMLILFVLGKQLEEEIYGPANLISLYVVSGLIGSIGYVLVEALQSSPTPALGASGAVYGVAVSAALFFPNRPIVLFFGLATVPLKWLVVGFVALDFIRILSAAETGVAHMAHLAGALGGLLFTKLDWRFFGRRRSGKRSGGGSNQFAPWFQRMLDGKPVKIARDDDESSRKPSSGSDPRTEALLDKISKQGIGSLTEEERRYLQTVSRRDR